MRGNAWTNPTLPALRPLYPSPFPPYPMSPVADSQTPHTATCPCSCPSALSSSHRLHQRLTWSALSTLPVCHVLPTPYPCRRRQVRSSNPLSPSLPHTGTPIMSDVMPSQIRPDGKDAADWWQSQSGWREGLPPRGREGGGEQVDTACLKSGVDRQSREDRKRWF